MGNKYGKDSCHLDKKMDMLFGLRHMSRFLSPSDTEVLCGQDSSPVGSGFVNS